MKKSLKLLLTSVIALGIGCVANTNTNKIKTIEIDGCEYLYQSYNGMVVISPKEECVNPIHDKE